MSGKRPLNGATPSHSKRRSTRPSSPPPPPSTTADVDSLVRHLAGLDAAGTGGTCPPAFSPTTNLLALAAPPPSSSSSSEHAFPFFDSLLDPLAPPPIPPMSTPPPDLGITLTHLSSPLSSVIPRVQIRLNVPTPLAVSSASAGVGGQQQQGGGKITLLSWSPDGESLLAVSSYPASSTFSGGDYITLFDHKSPCLDEGWEPILQEPVSRFSPTTSQTSPTSSSPSPFPRAKRVLSVRWLGEPRRWYPTPSFPSDRQNEPRAGKPLYCAPARSAPGPGGAGGGVGFVAVLSSDELLFIHLPRLPPPSAHPLTLLLPLSPSPLSPSLAFPLSQTALPTAPTPLPFAPSTSAADLASTAAAAMAAETSPQATMDALVTSLVSSSAAGIARGVGAAGLGIDASGAGVGGGGVGAGELAAPVTSPSSTSRRKEVKKAAIGAARSRGTAEAGETWFVIARWSGGGGPGGGGGGVGFSRRKREKKEVNLAQPAAPAAAEAGAADGGGGEMILDPDLSLFADFTSLDEAFGAPTPAAPAPASPAKPAAGAEQAEEEEDGEWGIEDWEQEEGWEGRGEREKWRVELSEVRVEMAPPPALSGQEGGWRPRLTVRPQPPLYLDPSPAPPASSSSEDAPSPTDDPLLTHLTFLGDVSLPHPLSALTSPSASLLADGSEPAVDLCLLSILAHPTRPAGEGEEEGHVRWRSTLTSYQLSLSPLGYALSDAFHALEGRRLDAPNVVEGESAGGWAGRKAASTLVGGTGGVAGVVGAVEIRPGGGEWASFVVGVAEPVSPGGEGGENGKEGEEGWRTRLVALSSVTLLPLDDEESILPNGINGHAENGEDGDEEMQKEKEEEHWLPGSRLYSSFAISPNGGLVCALPFSPSPSPAKPVIAAGALGRKSVPFTTRLALRLSIALARQSSTSDLSGLVASSSPEQAQAVMTETAGVLQKMLGENVQLEGSALGWELLGVVSGVYNAIPSLRPLAHLANSLLSLSLLVRSFTKSLSPIRIPPPPAGGGASSSSAPPVWRVEEDSIWPLVGWAGWFCGEWLDVVLSSIASRAAKRTSVDDGKEQDPAGDPTLVLLHPLSLSLLLSALDNLLSFRDFLIASSTIAATAGEAAGGASETVELARVLVEDACARAGGGRGVAEVREVVRRARSEVLGGEAALTTTKHSPPLLITLTLPPSLAAQATAARQIVADSYPSLATSSSSSSFGSSLPTPPGTPSPIDEGWDAVRRARLIPGQQSSSSSLLLGAQRERQCLRCGRRTAAAETSVLETAVLAGGAGKWRRYEEEWEGRCVCGGAWIRGTG